MNELKNAKVLVFFFVKEILKLFFNIRKNEEKLNVKTFKATK